MFLNLLPLLDNLNTDTFHEITFFPASYIPLLMLNNLPLQDHLHALNGAEISASVKSPSLTLITEVTVLSWQLGALLPPHVAVRLTVPALME